MDNNILNKIIKAKLDLIYSCLDSIKSSTSDLASKKILLEKMNESGEKDLDLYKNYYIGTLKMVSFRDLMEKSIEQIKFLPEIIDLSALDDYNKERVSSICGSSSNVVFLDEGGSLSFTEEVQSAIESKLVGKDLEEKYNLFIKTL